MHHRLTVGRTPWSARVPLDPLFAQQSHPHAMPRGWPGAAATLPLVRTMPERRRCCFQPAASWGTSAGGSACSTLALEDKWTAS